MLTNKYRNEEGELHREDGPAVEYTDGTKIWFFKGELHREGDLPAIEYADGTNIWFKNDTMHRLTGPAVERVNGTKEWYIRGLRHRLTGPAIEQVNGSKYWFIKGRQVSYEYIKAIDFIDKWRARIKRFGGARIWRLYTFTQTRAFCEWYYAPNQVGGYIAKQRIENLFS